ncbi:MAG: YciI family protein [Fulvivirga sp.]|uniref:YciI family protein n=1 Tax=Fulvivirga sp. TaxID=1931237 RepID=UPI0032ECDB55
MKTLLTVTLLVTCHLMMAQDKEGNPPMEIVKYYFVELITNPNKPELPKAQVDSIQRAHMANISQMITDKKLVLAGPFEKGGGIFILKVESMEEAEQLVAQDPAISAGRLTTEIRPWYTAKGSFVLEE